MIIEGEDGKTHINIYSKGKTELGRLLSNFAYSPFECEEGKFYSIEGYWYWLGTRDEVLKTLSGYQAKKYGQSLNRIYEVEQFEDKIRIAMVLKVNSNPKLFDLLLDSDLPFTHYYVFNGYRRDAGYEWIVQYWELIRKKIKDLSDND